MDIDILRASVDKIIENTSSDKVTFLLHGGEPLLMSAEWINQAAEYMNKKGKEFGKKITISMQSNLHHISNSKIEAIKNNGIGLGVSIDSDYLNPLSMRGDSTKTINNFIKLQSNGIKCGVITTINNDNFGSFARICDWLNNDLKVGDFKANVVYPVGAGDSLQTLNADQIFSAQKDIIDFMVRSQGKELIEYNIAYEINRLFSKKEDNPQLWNTLCQDKSCQAGNKVLGLSVEGNNLPCGRFTEASAVELDQISSVNEMLFATKENWANCNTCEAKHICNYGCLAFIMRSKSRTNIECSPTKLRYAYYQSILSDLKVVYDHISERNIFKLSYPDGRYSDTGYSDGSYSDYYSDGYGDKG
jgi:uncharacterized protein